MMGVEQLSRSPHAHVHVNTDLNGCCFVVVTGGVISGVGKGIVASSTGVLLKSLGLRVTSIKIDPYLNVDAGTLSPFDHGEVFVLDDGGEVDLDLGNYERFLDVTLTHEHNITTGKIYRQVIERERRGDYLGKTVQVVPHITDAIQDWIGRVACHPVHHSDDPAVNAYPNDHALEHPANHDDSASLEGHSNHNHALLPPQVCIIELGGTVGEIETGPFVEALRQFQFRVGRERFLCVHVALVPETGDGEQKSKPMQHSVRDLRGLGLTPDLIACRSSRPLDPSVRDKISLFCQVPPEHVVAVNDCESTYHVPALLESQGYLRHIHQRFQLDHLVGPYSLEDPVRNCYWLQWSAWLSKWEQAKLRTTPLVVGVVGKYTNLPDAYTSIARAVVHAATHLERSARIAWIEASRLEAESVSNVDAILGECHALIIAGGFGERGSAGKILACHWARLHAKPLLGICFGFQLGVVEWSRNVLGWPDAHTTEILPDTPHPVVVFMPEVSKTHMGGTMRLGLRRTNLLPQLPADNVIRSAYGNVDHFQERHRHRYEINPEYVQALEGATCPQTGQRLQFIGRDDTGRRQHVLQVTPHPFFVGVQFHPEYRSRTLHPSPVFMELLRAALPPSP
jgi:CTP synthase